MRYRVWDRQEKVWVHGVLLGENGELYRLEVNGILTLINHATKRYALERHFKTQKYPVGQTDKDQDFFEGDIVKYDPARPDQPKTVGLICHHNPEYFNLFVSYLGYVIPQWNGEMTLLGNIREHNMDELFTKELKQEGYI